MNSEEVGAAKPIRVLLADDHPLVRSGIRSLLDRVSEIEVVAEAGDGQEALSLIEEHQPDVVLMDIAMPNLNGLQATAYVTDKFPKVRVIILSMHPNEEYVSRAQVSGAAGYLVKNSSAAELREVIKIVAGGNTYFRQPELTNDPVQGKSDGSVLERLTPRQREVLRLIAEGGSMKSIALALNISPKTVEAHRADLMNRLDLHDIASLVRYAIRVGIVILDE
jgi:DNA-binding NarL/FixJ family response regulator